MDKANEYLRQAAECRELAQGATHAYLRSQFLEMAVTWEALAKEHEFLQKLRGDPEP